MEINIKVKSTMKIRAFYLFFIIFGIQTGVGIMGVPRYIFKYAKQDAWVSIIIALLFMIAVVYTMFFILNQYPNADIFGIQVDLFGKWIGKLLGTIYLLYFSAVLLSVLLTYIQVLHVFIYPTIPSLTIGVLLLSLTAYSVLGGLRVIVGVAFIFFLLTQWILLLLYDPISRMDWDHFLPLFQASIPDILKGTKATTYTVLGFEVLFFIYPFIDNKRNAKTPVILGLCYTTIIVLLATVVSIGYFSPEDLNDIKWSMLTLFKSVSFTFIERLDYIVIVEWLMVIIPILVLYMWALTYGVKRLYRVPQRTTLYIVCIILLFLISYIKYDYQINKITDILSAIGFWLVFVYPFLLIPFVLLKKKRKKKGRAAQ